jgi:pimeloyl-ACP methyl ester carboxylesterase
MAMLGERQVLTANGRSVRAAAYGDAEGVPVIWHHGNPGSRIAPISDAVLRDVGVLLIAYDRPGVGESDPLPDRRIAGAAVDARSIADEWRIPRFATIGFSGGGSHALATAALLPDRVVTAAVLSGAAPIDAEGLDFRAGMADDSDFYADVDLRNRRQQVLADMERTRQAILTDPSEALASFVAAWPESDQAALDDLEIAGPIVRGMAECVRVSAEGWLEDGVAFHRPWGFAVESINVPVAIWHGRDDAAAPLLHGRWLAEHIAGSILHELDGGHYAAYRAMPHALAWLAAQF